MKTKARTLLLILAITPLCTPVTADECATISCDCNSLASATWVDMCEKNEKALQTQCQNQSLAETGYCSVHGKNATRLALSLDTKTTEKQTNLIKLVGYKYTAILWSLNKDIEFISSHIDAGKFKSVEQRLRLLEQNSNQHFGAQKQLVLLLTESNNVTEIKKIWRSYSSDTETIASQLLAQGNRLLTATPSAKKARALGNELLNSAGGLYEQVGYAYAQAEAYKQAAQAWKQGAIIASNLLQAGAQGDDNNQAEYFRYQTATRYHRASQNWEKAKETERANHALEKSKAYLEAQ